MRNATDSAEPRASLALKLGSGFAAVVSVFYLINPTAGIFELLPDNLPIVGNMDEVFFTGVLFASLTILGIEIPMMRRRAK